jgi:hypothetical protein
MKNEGDRLDIFVGVAPEEGLDIPDPDEELVVSDDGPKMDKAAAVEDDDDEPMRIPVYGGLEPELEDDEEFDVDE